jgi:transcriptional regulator with XRE-family HTH domain
MKNIGKAICDARKKVDIRQGELADKAGVSQTYFSLVERGFAQPSLQLIERVADVLGLPVYYLAFMALDVDTEVKEILRDSYKKLRPAISGMIEGFFIDAK